MKAMCSSARSGGGGRGMVEGLELAEEGKMSRSLARTSFNGTIRDGRRYSLLACFSQHDHQKRHHVIGGGGGHMMTMQSDGCTVVAGKSELPKK